MGDILDNYKPLIPIFQKAPIEFSAREAKESYTWYLDNLDQRCEYLEKIVSQTSEITADMLDFTLESLKPLWTWFLGCAQIIPRDNTQLLEQVLRGGTLKAEFARDIIKTDVRVLSAKTEYLIRDIGMYVGKMFVTQYPQKLSWTYKRKPKNYIHVNEPLIVGFVQISDMRGNVLPKPFLPDFEPIHMTGVQAAKLLDNRENDEDLYRICKLWSGWIPND